MTNSFNVAPGVYKREIDRSQRIASVSNTIGVLVGPSDQGPVNQRVFITDKEELLRYFGRPNPRTSFLHYAALEFLNRGNMLYVTRVVNDDESRGARPLTAGAFYTVDDICATRMRGSLNVFDEGPTNTPKGLYDPMNTYIFNPNQPGIENVMFMVFAENPGAWNNNLYVRVRSSQKAETPDFDDRYDDASLFNVDVFLNYVSPRQAPDESFEVKLVKEISAAGNQLFIEDVINRKSRLIRVRVNPLADAKKFRVYEEAPVFFGGGTQGIAPSRGQHQRGWDLYKDPMEVDVNILIGAGAPAGMEINQVAALQRYIVDIAQDRMDCVALLDIPSSEQETSYAIAYRKNTLNTSSSYGAIYTPDIKIYDQYNDMEVWIPPSCFAAAACVVTDANFAPHFAPAGMDRGTLNGLESRFIYNQGKRNALDQAQINPIRFFSNGAGFKIYGASTLQVQASSLQYLPVRRLLCVIEKAIAIQQIYSVFDPNDTTKRSAITDMVESYLRPIRDDGGLYWFAVVCDESNNTNELIANGDLVLDVFLDPSIMVKRVKLRANILKTGVNFQELLTER